MRELCGRLWRAVPTRLRRAWKIAVLLIVPGCILAAGFVAQRWPAAEDSHRFRAEMGGLVCEDAVWDFGVVDALHTPGLSHDFVLVNESEHVVEIPKVRSSCGCMVGEGFQRTLAPGESTRVTVNVTLPPVPGAFQKELLVDVEGNSPGQLPLRVFGGIGENGSMYTIPSEVNFGAIPVGDTGERVMQVRRYDNAPIRLLEVTGSAKALACSFDPPSSGADPIATIRLSLRAEGLPPGDWHATITIRTEHEQFPTAVVRASANVVGADRGLVASILVAGLSPGESREVPLRRPGNQGELPKILSASYAGSPVLAVALVGGQSASDEPRLRITRSPGGDTASVVDGKAALRLENVEEAVEVPITVLCSRND